MNNFKVHRDAGLDLFPVTVLVGPNGGGKSALFDALMNFSMVSRGRLSEAFGPGPYSFEETRSHGTYGAARIGFAVRLSERSDSPEELEYEISYGQVGSSQDPGYVIFDERLSRVDSEATIFDRSRPRESPLVAVLPFVGEDRSIFSAIRRAQVTGEYEDVDPLVTHCAREVSRITKFRLDPSNLSRPATRPDMSPDDERSTPTPRLSYEGGNLAGVLAHMLETASPALDRLTGQIRQVMPEFEEFVLNNVGNDRVGFGLKYSDSRSVVTAANLSDGTLSLIGGLTLLAGEDSPAVLCLEEPENGMTPASTRILYQAVQASATSGEGAQVLMSSHSPFVICEAWNGEGREFLYQVKSVDGSSRIRKLVDIVGEHGIQLRKVDGVRQGLGLETADQVMAGYWS